MPAETPSSSAPDVATLGRLKEHGHRVRTVKQELRENLIARLKDGGPVFPGVRGYDDTVVPQVVHAIFSRHDMLFLGLRGQAKTRMIRQLPKLLDAWCPVVAGTDVPDDPIQPMTGAARRIVAERGDETPIRWMHRSERYSEKLATPDVTIADLIGEIDIVKYAQGRELSDESTMHFGLIPRSNRGIFAVNELPDLSPRIQVGLFNVLEERDVQIRGYPVRLNLDVCLVFSANPEDYTNRGRIVTPLKDRIGSVVRTHYPRGIDEAARITAENAWISRRDEPGAESLTAGVPAIDVPEYLRRTLEVTIAQARGSSHINQASGVSVRTSIACLETLVSSAERRGILTGEQRVVPRVCDLMHLTTATRGKIELMMSDDGDATEDKLVESLLGEAVKSVFDTVAEVDEFENVAEAFESGLKLSVGDEVSAAEQIASMKHVDGLLPAAVDMAERLGMDPEDDQAIASAGEFVLEALYVHKRLSKAGNKYTR
ncbi:sigma 54-interacting transcriptional regulator [Phycisphaera mikurensis]|uniref:Uncharacterized protein n=1 Tax=Phycisphaera mikurensis (strain NBRC 102666 / KCTC 22515 / FYK2301M01) TaxID=1142394 RepID=I0IIN6_PHYMF|nr:sigma 54-interacting transcriptional regulator [Phycisphaera mikurensis]MBB6442724.1 magnesium chelatase subunit I [Phycisphaera mikurensis]BAM05124.1 hypothetical protein PSMK_29650 [Phycisphaera mikurensis NBRC 102666]